MKTAIITGANSEIGFSICKFFLKENYKVIACIHENNDRIKKLRDDNLIIKNLDLTKEEEIASFEYKGDVIVNVAAYYYDDEQGIGDYGVFGQQDQRYRCDHQCHRRYSGADHAFVSECIH